MALQSVHSSSACWTKRDRSLRRAIMSLAPVQEQCEQGELLHGSQTCSALGSAGVVPRCADLTGLQLCLVWTAVFKPRGGTAKLENKAHGCVAFRVVDLTWEGWVTAALAAEGAGAGGGEAVWIAAPEGDGLLWDKELWWGGELSVLGYSPGGSVLGKGGERRVSEIILRAAEKWLTLMRGSK